MTTNAPSARAPTVRDRTEQWRALLPVCCGPALAAYGAAAAVAAAVVGLAPGGEVTLSGVARAAAAVWLAAHQVSLTIDAGALGALPLLVTAALVVLIARTAARAAARAGLQRPREAGRVAGTAAAGHGVPAVALAVPLSAADDGSLAAAPVSAAVTAATLAAVAAAAGVARRCGLVSAVVRRLPGWAPCAVAGGGLGLGVLLGAGAVAVLVGLAGSATRVRDLFAAWGPGAGTVLGLAVLCLAYLPNAVVGAASWLAGPGVTAGAVTATPFGVTPAAVPPVPLLAALPESGVGSWWLLVAWAPVLAGVVLGRRAAAAGAEPADRIRAATAGTGVLAGCCLVLAALAGGSLGTSGAVDAHAGQFALAVIGWAWPAAAAVAWWSGPRPAAASGDPPETDRAAEPEAPAAAGEDPAGSPA